MILRLPPIEIGLPPSDQHLCHRCKFVASVLAICAIEYVSIAYYVISLFPSLYKWPEMEPVKSDR